MCANGCKCNVVGGDPTKFGLDHLKMTPEGLLPLYDFMENNTFTIVICTSLFVECKGHMFEFRSTAHSTEYRVDGGQWLEREDLEKDVEGLMLTTDN